MSEYSADAESPACLHTMAYFLDERTPSSHSNKNANCGLFQVQAYFFSCSFFSMGIGKQTDAEIAVRQRHGAGRAAVSSHDPSVTQSDWGLRGRLQGRLQTGRLEAERGQKREGRGRGSLKVDSVVHKFGEVGRASWEHVVSCLVKVCLELFPSSEAAQSIE